MFLKNPLGVCHSDNLILLLISCHCHSLSRTFRSVRGSSLPPPLSGTWRFDREPWNFGLALDLRKSKNMGMKKNQEGNQITKTIGGVVYTRNVSRLREKLAYLRRETVLRFLRAHDRLADGMAAAGERWRTIHPMCKAPDFLAELKEIRAIQRQRRAGRRSEANKAMTADLKAAGLPKAVAEAIVLERSRRWKNRGKQKEIAEKPQEKQVILPPENNLIITIDADKQV